jgi:hypothetical protein
MKQPTPSDFIVNVKESSVSVIFKPSNSHYNFGRLADPEDIARYGPLSQPPYVRHGNDGQRAIELSMANERLSCQSDPTFRRGA